MERIENRGFSIVLTHSEFCINRWDWAKQINTRKIQISRLAFAIIK